ncbi:MAG: sigma-E processing peptidase SpoIIGA [Clostridia bacterium]|nr:sigma-E processing peptidase SpoIIGA [Clostridia bacterium]
MIRVIYGDVLLLIDFCMNFFVLYTASVILRRRIKVVCIAFAALVGGIYSVVKIFVSGNNIIDCIISFCVGLLICYICFGGYRFLKTAAIFYSVAALVGGLMYAIYYLLGSYHTDIYGYAFEYAYSHMPIWLFVVLAAISMMISWSFAYFGRESSENSEEDVIIEYRGKSETVKLLLDSGNLAKEPISGKNVVFISKCKAKTLLGMELYSAIVGKDMEKLLRNKFRLITVSMVDGRNNTYYGFLPSGMYIMRGKRKIDIEAYIAVSTTELQFCGCDGIAHPALMI